jgi:hypothetical protein
MEESYKNEIDNLNVEINNILEEKRNVVNNLKEEIERR